MPGWLPLLLGFLTAVGPLSTDMYLPAFPAIEAELGTGWGGAQGTLAAWFLGPWMLGATMGATGAACSIAMGHTYDGALSIAVQAAISGA